MNMRLMMARARMNHLPAPAPGNDPYWSNVISLLRFNGAQGSSTFTDEVSGNTWSAFGSATVDRTTTKWDGSVYLSTQTSYMNTNSRPLSDLNFTAQDYTVEYWNYPTEFHNDSFGRPFGVATSVPSPGVSDWQLGAGLGGSLVFAYWSGARQVITSSAGALALNSWAHIAMTFEFATKTVRLFVNGVLVASQSSMPNAAMSSAPLMVGLGGGGTWLTLGFIDEMRITKGVARYTSNFTPPTAPFPNHP
jgi:hypothetical protein